MSETRAIGEILRDAAAGRLENILAEEREPYDLIGAAERLFDLLRERKIEYVLVGGIAMLQYVEGRNTRDVDLILGEQALAEVPELVLSSRDHNFARALFEGIQVDVLFTSNVVFSLVQGKHSQALNIAGEDVTIATPQGLLLLKLFALPSLYRQGEHVRAAVYEADIAALIATDDVAIDDALNALAPHLLASDVNELRNVVADVSNRGKGFV